MNCRDICASKHMSILGRGRTPCVCMPVEKADFVVFFFNEEQKLGYVSSTVRKGLYS